MALIMCNKGGGGGGTIAKTFLYTFNLTQGGRWINTGINVSNIELFMFERVDDSNMTMQAIIEKSDIAVYTGGSDVYTNVYTQNGKAMNTRIYNNELYVSYNGTGYARYVTNIYKLENYIPSPFPFPYIRKTHLGFNDSASLIYLPLTLNSDYNIKVEFTANSYFSQRSVVGNQISPAYYHLTQYDNKWYASGGNGEINFTETLTGSHSFEINNGNIYFDNVLKGTYTPTSVYNANYIIGGRPVSYGKNLDGTIEHFIITSNSTGNTVIDLYPAIDPNSGIIGLADFTNGWFFNGGISIS